MKRVLCLLCCCLGLSACCIAANLELLFVEDSSGVESITPWRYAEWSVVVGEGATASEQYAAAELQRIFEVYTGVALPLVSAPVAGGKHIFIGPDAVKVAFGEALSAADLGEEGLRLSIRPDKIAITGGRPRGTLYGVYEFLERYLGVRFLTVDHTYVPKPREAVRIPCETFSFTPTFCFRWSYYGENHAHHDFAARLRCNTVTKEEHLGGATPQGLINHSFARQLPESKYAKEHPEYFALVDGKRIKRGKWDDSQPCCTNPEVVKIITESVLNDFRANPKRRNISVSMNDHHDYCECEVCGALDKAEGSHAAATLSLVNAVADEVKKEFPEAYVGTLAYYYTRKPPKEMKPRDNVQIQLCSIECCVTKPLSDPKSKKNKPFYKDFMGWAEISENIFIWNYNTNFHYYDMPFPNLRVIGPNIKLFAENNVKGVFMQACGNGYSGELSDLRNYLISRLLWNPDQEAWPLVEEFCRLHYQEAAPVILDYLAYIHDVAEKSGHEPNCFGDPIEFGFTKAVAAKTYAYFEEALALAKSPEVRARVEKASICACRMVLQLCGETKIESDRVRLVYPAPYEGLFERYKGFCKTYGMKRVAEHYGEDTYIKLIERRMAGLKLYTLENETWKLVVLPESNGKVLPLAYKAGDYRFGASMDTIFTVDYAYPAEFIFSRYQIEEIGKQGLPEFIEGFEAQQEGNRLVMTKTLEDGAAVQRIVSLDGDAIVFENSIRYTGAEAKTYQVQFHPEWYLGTSYGRGDTIRAYIMDQGEYVWFNEIWRKDTGPKAALLRSASGGGFAFFNKKANFGIEQRYDAALKFTPQLWWGYDQQHLNLELMTPEIVLEPGQDFAYSVRCTALSEPLD